MAIALFQKLLGYSGISPHYYLEDLEHDIESLRSNQSYQPGT